MSRWNINYPNYHVIRNRILGVLLIFLVTTSTLSYAQSSLSQPLSRNQALEGLRNLPDEYKEKFNQISNVEEVTRDSYEYLSKQWSPEKVSIPLTDSFPYSEDTLLTSIIDQWKSIPGYSYSKESVDDTEIVDIQTPEKSINIKTSEFDGKKLIEKTIITGKPRVTPIIPDRSILSEMDIPVRSKTAGTAASILEYNAITDVIEFGLDLELANIDKELSFEFLGIRFRAWARFIVIFRIIFPVRLTVEYPTEIIEGNEYEIRCTALPIDLPSKNEFEINIDIDIGFAIDNWWWHGHPRAVRRTVWDFGKWLRTGGIFGGNGWTRRWVTEYVNWHWDWNTLFSQSLVDINYFTSMNYKTPLAGEHVSISFPEIDVFSLIPAGFLSNILYLGLGLGNVDLYGKMVTGSIIVLPSILSSRLVSWTSSNQTQSLLFSISNALLTPEVSFSVGTLFYHFEKAVSTPTITFGFKNFWLGFLWIPLREWLGRYTWYLNPIPLPLLPIPSFKTITTSLSIREDYEAIYNFTFDVVPSAPYQFSLSVSNPNLEVGQSDTIDLSITGLPQEYQALFSQTSLKLYGMPEEFSSPDFPSSKNASATLTIIPPRHTSLDPGDLNFTISAISRAKVLHGVPEPLISKNASFIIPEVIDFDFNLETTLYEGTPITPGLYFPINFFGGNTGNLNDTIYVNATLYTHSENRRWNASFNVDSFGSGSTQYFSSEFGFIFSKEDLYPEPGFYRLEIQAMSLRSPFVYETKVIYLNFTEDYEVTSHLEPLETTIFANWETEFIVLLNNTGNTYDNFTVESAGWDTYLTYPTRIVDLGPSEVREFNITLSVPDPAIVFPQPYTFRIKIQSENDPNAASVQDVNVMILPPDEVPPAILGPDSSEDLVYPQSSLSLGPTWMAFDPYPKTYEVYINDTIYDSGNWLNNTPINVPLTGINPKPLGIYNVTILFRDVSNNVARSHVWVSIKPPDSVTPVIVSLPGLTSLPLNFVDTQSLSWECSEEYLLNVTIYRNNTKIPLDDIIIEQDPNNSSIWYSRCLLRPSTLVEGIWNYTIRLQDMGTNFASSSRFLEITSTDTVISNIIDYPNATAILGHGESFSVTVVDQYPDTYELFNGLRLISRGTWQSNIPIIFNVDSLELTVGLNNLDFYFFDLAGNQYYLYWPFTLIDVDPPVFTNVLADFTLFEHNYTNIEQRYWQVADWDIRFGLYSIFRNSISASEGSWLPGNSSIPVPVQNILPGIHVFESYFEDATGNTLYSTLQVTMLDILNPYISPLKNIQFEPLLTADWFEFFIVESHPVSYSLYRDGVLLRSAPLSNDFPVVFVRIEDYSVALYNYTLIVEDESGNIGSQSVLVKVTDFNPPLIKRPSDIVISEGSPGQEISWEIIEANPLNYSLYHNTVLYQSGTLVTSAITYSLTDLPIGTHTFTLVVYDQFDLSHTSTSYVTVLDMTPPVISHIDDCRFVESDPNAYIEWKAFDRNPLNYIISIDNNPNPSQTWDGSDILLRFSLWAVGNYTVKISMSDSSGNTVSDELRVEIVSEESVIKVRKISPGFSLIVGLMGVILTGYLRKSRKEKKED
ncbi:MAG: COG1470 family protein [Candidatus Kariarchaeaceae archaeon]|jgi:hypothetical protein